MAIDSKKAIDAAFDAFREFIIPTGDATIRNTLLEELKKVDGNWSVTVGFDIGREKSSNVPGLGIGREVTPIREYRTFIIDSQSGEMIEIS